MLAAIAWQAAYRGVQVSAIVMLVLEVVSVSVICVLVGDRLARRTALRSMRHQLRIEGGFPGGIGLAIAFAVFSFVGFESATAFGAEAKRPLVNIPRAVIGSVLFASAFFVIATYAEIVGLAHLGKPLDKEQFPLQTLVAGLRARLSRDPDHGRRRVQRLLGLSRLHHHRRPNRLCDGPSGTLPRDLRAHRAASTIRPTLPSRSSPRRRWRSRPCALRWASRRSTFSTTAERSSSFGFILIYMLIAIGVVATADSLENCGRST